MLPVPPAFQARDQAYDRRLARLILVLLCLWLTFLIYPAVALLQEHDEPASLVIPLIGSVLFFLVYFRAIVHIARTSHPQVSWITLALLTALGLVVPLLYGSAWIGFFVYIGLLVGLSFPLRKMIISTAILLVLTLFVARITAAPWGEVVALTLVTLLGSGMAFGLTWVRAINQVVQSARAQAASLAAHEERLRIARELHDAVKQQVFITSMEIGAARALLSRDPHGAEAHLQEAEQVIRQVHVDLDALIRELRPASLEEKGLIRALREYVADWARRTRIAAEVRTPQERAITREAEQALFRVAQEALANVAKHSQASSVVVEVKWIDKAITLQIIDNGRGFPLHEAYAHESHGVLGMHERMEALGGRLILKSAPGQGTHLTCICPVPESQNNEREEQ